MRKIIVGARVSMDGVMQEPMGPSEGFKLGGWASPYQDQDCWEEFDRLYFSEKLDLLLGRKTYEIFAAYWPYQVWEDAPNGASRRSSRRSRSTWFRGRATSIRAGRARCY